MRRGGALTREYPTVAAGDGVVAAVQPARPTPDARADLIVYLAIASN